MLEAVGPVLGTAVGVAISPVPMIALILMLLSPAALRNALAFLAGWVAGLTAVGLIVLALGFGASEGGGESDGGAIVKLAIGALLGFLAVRQWRGRPRAGEEPALPRWMSAIDTFSPIRAFGLALLLSAVNPKNLGLTVAAAATISAAGLERGQEVATLLIFVAIGACSIAAPTLVYALARKRAASALDELRIWLTDNNATVMCVLFAVLGAKVFGDGLAIIA